MNVIVGTSGYSYKEWKGSFYPDDLPASKMLSFYAAHFGAVEINNTFYRMPGAGMLEKWAAEVPDGFVFVLKAPQRITHFKRLVGSEDDVRYLFEVAGEALGSKLGPVLFQLPPNMKKDAGKLREFFFTLPRDRRFAFEFRHDSWLDEEIYTILRERDAALCLSDTDESGDPEQLLIPTASWGYLRLRRTEYLGDQLSDWAKRVERQPWQNAFVFFKHEDEGKGPAFAKTFLGALSTDR